MNTQKGNVLVVALVALAIGFGIGVYFSGDSEKMDGEEMATGAGEYTVTIKNVSESQPLSPAVVVVHSDSTSVNFEGILSPKELEPLAEYGDNSGFVALLNTVDGVEKVMTLEGPVLPGEMAIVELDVERDGLLLSIVSMAVGSNDGVVLLDAVALDGTESTNEASNYDNGTEENEDLLSGFDGGQPDPERGAENVENGTATDPQEEFTAHDQLTDTIMEVMVTPAE